MEAKKNVENSLWRIRTYQSCIYWQKYEIPFSRGWIWTYSFFYIPWFQFLSFNTFNFTPNWFRFSADDFFRFSGCSLGFRFLFLYTGLLTLRIKAKWRFAIWNTSRVYLFWHGAGFKLRLIAPAWKRYKVYRKFLIRLYANYVECCVTKLLLPQHQRYKLAVKRCPHFREMREVVHGWVGSLRNLFSETKTVLTERKIFYTAVSHLLWLYSTSTIKSTLVRRGILWSAWNMQYNSPQTVS